ncbi:class I SAM-dependent methyltransferase [Pelagibius litoralis]|uniref:Class I SAM-dependent methyltransferase n=1 Tax=Pelagibius litoralis TaxID=374515 RepID=A0A967EVQ9_9PROT|nr:class I SAM-dependent methyltransferase [Pelagibius litoralis]NIA68897.1 class I SAM-dependent methyltransferase [Pelagibius litoralis]
MSLTKDQIVAANRASWNEAAAHHREHDQWTALLKGFAQPGHSVLDETMAARLQAIGLEGRAVAQLCCNNARELLSIKNLGAASVTGFDFAEEFLDQGRELAAAGGIEAELVQTDINKIPSDYDGRFDLAVVTIGVFGWQPDLAAFFATAQRILKPGGRIFIYEDHPILNMYEDREERLPPVPDESYFRSDPYRSDDGLDYWAKEDYDAKPCFWMFHKMSDVIMALVTSGFAIEDFEEFPHNIGTREQFENQPQQLPLSYVLVGRKEG